MERSRDNTLHEKGRITAALTWGCVWQVQEQKDVSVAAIYGAGER